MNFAQAYMARDGGTHVWDTAGRDTQTPGCEEPQHVGSSLTNAGWPLGTGRGLGDTQEV